MEKTYTISSSRFTSKLWMLLLCVFCWCGTAQGQVFWEDNFETAGPNMGGGDRDAPNHTDRDNGSDPSVCGSSDYFYRTDCNTGTGSGSDCTGVSDVFANVQGSFMWRGEDLDGCISDPDQLDFTGIDITGRTNLAFKGLFACDDDNNEWEGPAAADLHPDSISVLYQIDGGGYLPGIVFRSDGSANATFGDDRGLFRVDTDNDGFGDGATAMDKTFREFSFNISGTGTTLDIRIIAFVNGGGEEFGFDLFQVEEAAVTIVCPTVGATATSISAVCLGDPFDVDATGLVGLDMATNMVQDFGIRFVAFTSTPADPYVGGTDLGTVPFGSLTAGNTAASLTGTSLAMAGSYEVYAVLAPTPADMSCRPSAMTSITVNPLPTVLIELGGDFCVSDAASTVDPFESPTGGVYSGPGVTDDGNGNTFTFDPAVAGTGTIAVVYTVTDVNGCSNFETGFLTVNADPTVTFSALADLCVNDGVQTGQGGGMPTGGVYSGAGVTDDGNGMTYSFDPAVAGVGVTTITYTFTNPSGCTGMASDDVEVFAIPTVTFTAPADLCIDAGVQTGLGGGMPTGGVYSGAGVSDDGNGMTYSFDPAAAGVGTTTITYTVGAAGCSDSAMDDVEVFDFPMVTLSIPAGSDEFCESDPATTIDPTESLSGGVYSGAGVTDDGNGDTFTFDPSAAGGSGTVAVTYTVTDMNGCSNFATAFLTVNADPTVTYTAPADLCLDAGVQTGLGGGMPTGGVYSGAGVTDDGNGMTYNFDPAVAGVGVTTITYTFTNGSGCTGMASDDVEVFALPSVTFTALADLCLDAGVQAGLGGGMPTGGVYSGAGVSDDGNGMTYSFDPIAADTGTTTITYSLTDANGCMAMATDDVEVFGLPSVSLAIPAGSDEFCVNDPVTLVNLAGTPTGGVYSGNGVTDLANSGISFTFDPAAAGVGMTTVTYTVTDANGCTGLATDVITVNDLPTVAFTAPADLCIDAGVQTGLGGGMPTGGVYSGAGVTDDGNGMTYSFDPAAAGVGTTTITYTLTDANSCTATASDDTEVFPLPMVTFTAPADLCEDAGIQSGLGGGMPTGGVYSGIGVIDDGNGMTYSFNPLADTSSSTITITYTFTDANGCSASVSDDVEIFDLPFVSLSTAAAYCLDAPIASAPLTGGMPSGGVYSGPGVTDLGDGTSYNLDPTAGGPGVITITYTFTDANGCTNAATSDINILDCAVSITDPCSCLDNATVIDLDNATGGDDGQFSEIISVVDNQGGMLPAGQTWTVTAATGAFDANNIPAVGMQSAGVPVATDGSVTLAYNMTTGSYELPFVHVDAQGYSITVVGPFPVGSAANSTLMIGNNCQYPNPVFDPVLPDVINSSDPAITLGGTDTNGNGSDAVSFTIDGMMATSFDPAGLAAGNYTVVMSFDGADDGNNGVSPDGGTTPASPGCVQTVQKVVEVIVCSPPSIACPANDLDLPAGCNPMVPAGATTFNVGGMMNPDPALPTVTD
ncbi:MAG: hypothetical protein AAFV25_04215, partial [Bacteroidota bacterium]